MSSSQIDAAKKVDATLSMLRDRLMELAGHNGEGTIHIQVSYSGGKVAKVRVKESIDLCPWVVAVGEKESPGG